MHTPRPELLGVSGIVANEFFEDAEEIGHTVTYISALAGDGASIGHKSAHGRFVESRARHQVGGPPQAALDLLIAKGKGSGLNAALERGRRGNSGPRVLPGLWARLWLRYPGGKLVPPRI